MAIHQDLAALAAFAQELADIARGETLRRWQSGVGAGDAAEDLRTFVYAEPQPGSVFLWESWLRHEVVPSTGKGERISISFNYR